MNIVVCIKQVPDTTEVKIDPKTNTLIREGVASIINPFDLYAIEEGVRLKEKFGGKVTVISMGPKQVENALREAISLGADEAVLMSDRAFAGSDTLATSLALSEGIKRTGFDVIICGKQAIDGDTAQVGPGIAAHLDIPQITYVKKIESVSDGKILAERMVEEGYEVVESTLPVLLTVVKEINEPRLPSLKGKMKAKKTEIKTITSEDLAIDKAKVGLDGSPTWVMKIFTPPKKEGGKIFEGSADEVVAKLIGEIQDNLI